MITTGMRLIVMAAAAFGPLICSGTAAAETPPAAEPLNADTHYVQVVSGWDALLKHWRSLSPDGLRLTDIERYDNGGIVEYVALWTPGDGEDYLWGAGSWAEFEAKTLELAARDLRLVDVEIFPESNQARYVGVWRSGTGDFAVWVCPTWEAFTDKWQALAMAGLHLADVEAYRDQGATHYFGLFRSDIGEENLWMDEDWDEISQ